MHVPYSLPVWRKNGPMLAQSMEESAPWEPNRPAIINKPKLPCITAKIVVWVLDSLRLGPPHVPTRAFFPDSRPEAFLTHCLKITNCFLTFLPCASILPLLLLLSFSSALLVLRQDGTNNLRYPFRGQQDGILPRWSVPRASPKLDVFNQDSSKPNVGRSHITSACRSQAHFFAMPLV